MSDALSENAVLCPTCGALPCDQTASPLAWLIEASESDASAPLYWAGYFGDERDHWTQDHTKAVRLARKQDAQAVSDGVLHGYAVRIAEHAWDNT